MRYTKLGRSGLHISRLVLGTMNFGCLTDERESFRIMDAALDAGINYFDTANNYGKSIGQEGITEEVIGRWFSQGGGRRQRVVLATKVHEDMNDASDGPNGKGGLSAYKIRRHFEASLRRLQTDHVELYYMHHIDRNVEWEELWQAFDVLIHQGKIDYAASSNFAGWDIAVAQAKAKQMHMMGLACEQHLYNLMCRTAELEVLPSAEAHGLGVVAWSPLQGGLLARNALVHRAGTRGQNAGKDLERCRGQLEAFAHLCGELGEQQDNVALAWLHANARVTAPIIGPRTLRQFEDSLHSLDIVLQDDVMRRLDEIFPGPGGAAPESYAW